MSCVLFLWHNKNISLSFIFSPILSKTRCSIHSDKNPHIPETGISPYLAFLIDKWQVSNQRFHHCQQPIRKSAQWQVWNMWKVSFSVYFVLKIAEKCFRHFLLSVNSSIASPHTHCSISIVSYLWAERWAAWRERRRGAGGGTARASPTEASFLWTARWGAEQRGPTQTTSSVRMLSSRRAASDAARNYPTTPRCWPAKQRQTWGKPIQTCNQET